MEVTDTTLRTTFQVSIAVQIVAIALSIAALLKDDASDVLRLILGIELVTSGVQLVWYLVVVFLYYFRKAEGALTIVYRFIDWTITTPIMWAADGPTHTHTPKARALTNAAACVRRRLLTLNLLLLYWKDDCVSVDAAFSDSFIVGNVIAVVADLLMLLAGVLVELEKIQPEYELNVTWGGFVPLLVAYIPSLVIVGAHYTVHGLLVIIASLLVWAAYGGVAVQFHDQRDKKAACYNILDIFSKNVFAIAVSLSVLTVDLNCSTR